jgi:hypothetical protein
MVFHSQKMELENCMFCGPFINIMYRWMLVPVSVIFTADCHYIAKR